MKRLINWIRRHNEFTFVVFLIILIWYAAPPLLRLIDPQAGEFGVEMLYIPLIAGIFFFMGLLIIWLYLRLVFPAGFRILDNLFEYSQSDRWESSRLLLRLFGYLVILYSVSLLAVTGVSVIM